jgi:hypothetical protein
MVTFNKIRLTHTVSPALKSWCVDGGYTRGMSKGKKVEESPSFEAQEPETITGSGVFLYPNGGQYEGEWKSVNGIKFRNG